MKNIKTPFLSKEEFLIELDSVYEADREFFENKKEGARLYVIQRKILNKPTPEAKYSGKLYRTYYPIGDKFTTQNEKANAFMEISLALKEYQSKGLFLPICVFICSNATAVSLELNTKGRVRFVSGLALTPGEKNEIGAVIFANVIEKKNKLFLGTKRVEILSKDNSIEFNLLNMFYGICFSVLTGQYRKGIKP